MVHLSTVPNDSAVNTPLVEGLQNVKFDEGPDEATASIYGSRFAAQDLPNHAFPDQEM